MVCKVKNRKIAIQNNTNEPILLKKSKEFVQLRPITTEPVEDTDYKNKVDTLHEILRQKEEPESYLSRISVDPHQQLTQSQRDEIWSIIRKFATVFDGDLTGGYNNASGPCQADFNFADGTKPAPNKGYFPRYSHLESLQLQAICDHMEDQGVMADPETLGIPVLHTSPLLLVVKPKAKDKTAAERTIKDLRLVGAFNHLNEHIQSIPAIRKSPDETFRIVAKFKYIFVADASDLSLIHI